MKAKKRDGVLQLRPPHTNQAMGLRNFARDTAGGTIVEIGSYAGDGTAILAKYFDTVYAVDPWQAGYDGEDGASETDMTEAEKKFDKKTRRFSHVIKMRMPSSHAVKLFEDESIDVVYIDALHTFYGVKQDISMWYPKVKKDGYIAGHDFEPKWLRVLMGIVETVGIPEKDYEDGSWRIKKSAIHNPRFAEVGNE